MRDLKAIADLKALLPQCLLPDQVRIGLRLAKWIAGHGRDTRTPGLLERWLAEARTSIARRRLRQQNLPSITYPLLPITACKDRLVEAIRQHQVLIIAGETGSGKTTQLPKMCLEAGLGIRARIGCTQPRRVAALSLSRRLADELGVELGDQVGCKIRFTDKSSPQTIIKFMTDGILLAEMQADPYLSEYEVLIIDEAHERSLNIDFLLGHLVQLLTGRSDLKLIITSATIDTEAFSNAFNQAPVIEVSGRLYPVEVLYAPLDATAEDSGELTYVDAAAQAVIELLDQWPQGDILVFMPGERDILETRDVLQTKLGSRTEIIPLFGRLSAEDQQRVFAPTSRRKVVVATNIAETSLTVPGIRFVVDTGLARVSRYNPRTRTKRLPIEPISQSSANQRKGRCGRVSEGLCVRLYSEEDFRERPIYSQPEIQRANLADVILRMKASRLGDIETFPFINPPKPQAIQGGYQLLQELGALDEQLELTPIGRDLARLPIDPTIGRMVIQANHEGALNEVLIIAAGLSIQDPRERPVDRLDTAATAHRRFHDDRSDFLSLLNIWTAYHDTWESLKTQSQLRKFCRAHFLSYLRMREWRDIHAQLVQILRDTDGFEFRDTPADFNGIHRSIITGLWSHVALKQDRNLYQLAGNRQAMIFPGSGLFQRTEKTKKKTSAPEETPRPAAKPAQPQWIMAGEIMETSRLFLRNVAAVDPQWIVELATHLCKRRYDQPHWDPSSGRVLATEHITLHGLEVLERTINYDHVDAPLAAEIFIRSALVEAGLRGHLAPRQTSDDAALAGSDKPLERARVFLAKEASHPQKPIASKTSKTNAQGLLQFLDHNDQLRHKIELWQTRLQHRVVPDLDEAFYACYARHLKDVSSVHELRRWLREAMPGDRKPLCFEPVDLLGDQASSVDLNAFPDSITLGDQTVEVSYAYAPGQDQDGVTLKLPFTLAQIVDASLLDWAVPGLRQDQILHLLQSLPKQYRRPLMPLPDKARELATIACPKGGSFLIELARLIRQNYGVDIPGSAWSVDLLPAHLRPRLEIIGKNKQPVAIGRNLEDLRGQLQKHGTTIESDAWRAAVHRWERYHIQDWPFDDLPDQITVADVAGFPLYAHLGLQTEEGGVSLRLFVKKEQAQAANQHGLPALARKVLQRDLGWLQKDLRCLSRFKDLYITLGPGDDLEPDALENLAAHVLCPLPQPPFTRAVFNAYIDTARRRLPGLAPKLVERVGQILTLRQQVLLYPKPYPGMRSELDALVPPQFLRHVAFDRLPHLIRYLKALLIRAERAALNPVKDAEKVRRVRPHVEALRSWVFKKNLSAGQHRQLHELRWLIEEYKVSCFAQELGTAEPVSPRILQEKLASLDSPT